MIFVVGVVLSDVLQRWLYAVLTVKYKHLGIEVVIHRGSDIFTLRRAYSEPTKHSPDAKLFFLLFLLFFVEFHK